MTKALVASGTLQLDTVQPKSQFTDVSGGIRIADTSQKDLRSEPERRADRAENASDHAIDVKLKLLAYELHAAGQKLDFDMALADASKTQDRVQIEAAGEALLATVYRLDNLAHTTQKQIDDLNIGKNEPRLESGGQHLLAALDEFAPVMARIDTWMIAHKLVEPTWEVHARIKAIIKFIFPALTPTTIPLTKVEKRPGFVQDESIDANLDAAIAAARSVKSGNHYDSKRVVLHAKELGALLPGHSRLVGPLKPRIKELVRLADEILVKNPYLTRSFNEALDPIRNVE